MLIPQPIYNTRTYINGDVSIDPSAALAPGVILQAAPDSRIRIGAGVCVGMGVIVNAYRGVIAIENGVTLGPGVLIIGAGTIGRNACVGAATTIFNTCVDAAQVIPPGSLLGDPTRQVQDWSNDWSNNGDDTAQDHTVNPVVSHGSSQGFDPNLQTAWGDSRYDRPNSSPEFAGVAVESEHQLQGETAPFAGATSGEEAVPPESEEIPGKRSTKAPVFGQTYVNQLLVTIFPDRQP